MLDKELRSMLDAFRCDSRQLDRQLDSVKGMVSQDCFQPDEVETLKDELKRYRERYENIHKLIAKYLDEEEAGKRYGQSVGEILETVAASQGYQYERDFQRIRELSKVFLSVKAIKPHYEDALKPYQEEIKRLLEAENTRQLQETEKRELSERSIAIEIFIRALECEDLGTDQGLELLDEVTRYFPRRVEVGLTRNIYYIPEENRIEAVCAKEEAGEIRQADNTVVPEKSVNLETAADATEASGETVADGPVLTTESSPVSGTDASDAGESVEATQGTTHDGSVDTGVNDQVIMEAATFPGRDGTGERDQVEFKKAVTEAGEESGQDEQPGLEARFAGQSETADAADEIQREGTAAEPLHSEQQDAGETDSNVSLSDAHVAEPAPEETHAEDQNTEEIPLETALSEHVEEGTEKAGDEETKGDDGEPDQQAPDEPDEPTNPQRLAENIHLIIQDEEEIGRVECSVQPAAEKDITAEEFLKDIQNGTDALKRTVQMLSKRSIVTLTALTDMYRINIGNANNIVEYLMKKGYLQRYRLVPGGTLFAETERFAKAMQFDRVTDSLSLMKRGDQDRRQLSGITSPSLIATLMAYIKMVAASMARYRESDTETIVDDGFVKPQSFCRHIFPAGAGCEGELNIGVFWTDISGEINYFIYLFDKMLDEMSGPLDRINCMAMDMETARHLYEWLSWLFGCRLEAREVYLYSFVEDCKTKFTGTVPPIPVLPPLVKETPRDEEPAEENEPVVQEPVQIKEPEPVMAQPEVAPVPQKTAVQSPEPESEPEPEPEQIDPESDLGRIYTLLIEKKYYAASAYARVTLGESAEDQPVYQQLAYALHDPMVTCSYTSDHAFTMIERHTPFEDALMIAIAIRTFFLNQVRYDYNIKPFYSAIKEFDLLAAYPVLSRIVFDLMDFKDTWKMGMDAYADYRTRSRADREAEIRNVQREARQYYESFILSPKKETVSIKRFIETKKIIYSVNGELGQCMKIVADGDEDAQPLVVEFLRHFFRDDSEMTEETLDQDLLWIFISDAWDRAGEMLGHYKRFDELKSHLRSNITSTTTRGLLILIHWCNLIDQKKKNTVDEGGQAYRRNRATVMENIRTVTGEMEAQLGNRKLSCEQRAGMSVIIETLNEVYACLEGTYNESMHRYYYVPFLLGDDVLLEETFLPDFDMHGSDLAVLAPAFRILEHVRKFDPEKTYEKRLDELLTQKGDDYGSAQLIVSYLRSQPSAPDLSETEENIQYGEAYARETADLRRDDFTGELELAQSYGQIDNSVEDKKEKILQIVDAWYEWARDTWNYGFFYRVMQSYLSEIREEAKPREKDLLEQLERFRASTVQGFSAEAKARRIERIQAMIEMQNYTVAEDLLARPYSSDEETETLIEEDFLEEFLQHYDDYYQPVASQKTSLANLLSKRTHNKEERGSKRMVENWLPGGSAIGRERLQNLLGCFGFAVDNIQPQDPIGRFEHFVVKTKAQRGGAQVYTHPIAAFGSGAATDGFRVVCLNGAYDADALIEVMRRIGNAKHTMILLDYALSISERRRLARKTKNALEDKLFLVVDRVVVMYLVRNYDETRIQRMLISLTTPFGYYQPYVWESANVMPPEIFMGRKRELERIKSPTGVNIVYGGRQLGKSALLKKAREEIDGDENGNRAVLVEIKGLGYRAAARKIGEALYDEHILDTDLGTEDWNTLARAIRRRLQSSAERIPYLLLLLDEADAFIESCSEVNYQPLDALKEIQSIGAGRFKFVVAGLRNIIRFRREALEKNSVLTHLEPMTVKPFDVLEARELMEIPLYYLGLRFPKEKTYLISLILATTNYFPGLIQMYCAKLVDALRERDYARYDEIDTPIYEVSEEHIKRILSDPDFNSQIREKFLITLKLDEDNYYYLIALLMAYLYHTEGYNEGYSAEEIRKAGEMLEITKIANMENQRLVAFMEELGELNVLRNTDETHYLFTRFAFFQMMGTRSEVEDKLTEYMGE